MIKPRAKVLNSILMSKRSEKHQDKNSPKRQRKHITQKYLKDIGFKDEHR